MKSLKRSSLKHALVLKHGGGYIYIYITMSSVLSLDQPYGVQGADEGNSAEDAPKN